MKTRYIGIESICVIDKEDATIACNIMFEGIAYDEPIYTNIFCSYNQLFGLLNLENSNLAKEVIKEIETQLIISEEEVIQIDLPDYLASQIEWNFKTMIDLKISENEDIPFQCYAFD